MTLHEIVACVASVYVWFRSEERLRNGIFVPPSFLPKLHGNACYAG